MKKILSALALFVLALAQTQAQPEPYSPYKFHLLRPQLPKTDYFCIGSSGPFAGGKNGTLVQLYGLEYGGGGNAWFIPTGTNEDIIGFADSYMVTKHGKIKDIDRKNATLQQAGDEKANYNKVAYNANNNEYWVVGDSNAFIRGIGESWVRGTIPLNSVNNFTAADFRLGIGYFGTEEGKLFVLTNNNWDTISIGTNKRINSIFANTNDMLFIACDDGIILRMNIKTKEIIKNEIPQKEDVNDIIMMNSVGGYAMCDNGVLCYTSNGGKTWEAIDFKDEKVKISNDFCAAAKNDKGIHIIGENGMYLTIDKHNGAIVFHNMGEKGCNYNDVTLMKQSFEPEYIEHLIVGDRNTIIKMSSQTTYTYPICSYTDRAIIGLPTTVNLLSVAVNNEKRAFIVANNNILYRSQNNDYFDFDTIKLNHTAELNKVRFFRGTDTNMHGFVLGSNSTLFRSIDDGKTWKQIVLPGDFDLNDICYYNDKLYIIGDDGCVFRSEDKGETWANITAHIKSLIKENTDLETLDLKNFCVNNKSSLCIGASAGHLVYYFDTPEEKAVIENIPTQNDVSAAFVDKYGNHFAFCEEEEAFYKTSFEADWKPLYLPIASNINTILYSENNKSFMTYLFGDNDLIFYNSLRYSSSVEDEARETIKVYPNPATDRISIDMQDIDPQQIDKIELYDASNRFISVLKIESTNNTTTSEIGNIPSGMYLLKVFSPRGIEYIKFIKQ